MILIGSGVLIDVWRDSTGVAGSVLMAVVGNEEIVMTRPIEMELIAGAASDQDKAVIAQYVTSKRMLELSPSTWRDAAELYYSLRRKGVTIRRLFECCIAQVALENSLLLIHDDRDFTAMAPHYPLAEYRLSLKAISP